MSSPGDEDKLDQRLMPLIARTLNYCGFDAAKQSSLNEMKRVLSIFMVEMMSQVTDLANHCSRTDANTRDVVSVLSSHDCSVADLLLVHEDFVNMTSKEPLVLDHPEDAIDEVILATAFGSDAKQMDQNLEIIMPNEKRAQIPRYAPLHAPPLPPVHTYRIYENGTKRRAAQNTDHHHQESLTQASRSRTRSRHLHPRILALHAKVQARRVGEASLENLVRNVEARTLDQEVASDHNGPALFRPHVALGSVVNYRANRFAGPR